MTAPSTTDEVPPPFEPTNTINLVSVDDSKIVHVSLYSGRAEITRLYNFPVKTGQNQVNINGLPNVLDRDSIRVEGRGAATIHDVTLSDMPQPPTPSSSAHLDELILEKELAEKALARARKGLASLEAYLSTLNVQHTDVATLDKVIEHYDTSGGALDKKILDLEKRIKKLEGEIKDEQEKIDIAGAGAPRNQKLGVRAAIGIFAAAEGEVAIALIYAVREATWGAAYDVRVDMQAKEKPVTLIYKAGITQDTGESWDDVPLTLETASPTFGLDIPALYPWRLYVSYSAPTIKSKSMTSYSIAQTRARLPSITRGTMGGGENGTHLTAALLGGGDENTETMGHRGLAVTSKGGISATFQVPGSITVPSDGASHNVTVVQLKLDASMSWVTVPKIDVKTRLKAKIKNASDYTLLPGVASVYVDGSFISRSNVPLISPLESFDCPLGLDPSIRITYHPRSKNVSRSGFYSKASTYAFSQRITVYNTKSVPITDLKVIEQLPVSQVSQVTVKLLSPALVLPDSKTNTTSASASAGKDGPPAPAPVRVAEGVLAQWEGADEEGVDVDALGRDGKFYWVCAVPAQGKVNLLLSWEVTAPSRTHIVGL
ncbi:putative mucoidy inhibitor A [Lyophyllum shimeji]|uniref:Mucoidy inhibitor A n=1 Tax=Lyophyllum shimeji TaxID=47721 RepID=A0A9P3PYA0_LYOSH|nr:putative mucoidy inhibitor A [Lyophyllum shimeji]